MMGSRGFITKAALLLLGGAATAAVADFTNPVLWEDLADLDIFRVGDAFYYSASTMAYSPGAPILRSYDLVNWEFVGHSVPVLDFGPTYDLDGGQAYVEGIWASFCNYRPSNQLFYWGGCIRSDLKTHIYTASDASGEWSKHAVIDNCYYDAGLLVDTDDKLYVAYGSTNINVAELSADGTSEVSSQVVFNSPSNPGYIEGSRFYNINGTYYIFLTRPPDAEYVLKSTSGPFGPYEGRYLVDRVGAPVASAGAPHQGGIVDTPNGDWYYMSFIDAYPGGRMPVLAPITWDDEGWPSVTLVNGAWGQTYPSPDVLAAPATVEPPTGIDTFSGSALSHQWEWNHNPDNTKWSLDGGLRLQTATVTDDLYAARNTLTHRILGPASTGTIVLDFSSMADGDRAGLSLFRDQSAWIGIVKDNGATKIAMWDDITMDADWNTNSTGSEVASADISGSRVWLRLAADIAPAGTKQGVFSYSNDGETFTTLGTPFTMITAWQYFIGYRFGIFNFATQALGGSVLVESFEMVLS
ncbi:putative xylosidase glycosyl hydrolase protein [Neofusicoccum parvum UCRNP2]|uniref:Putative xylosidase glycosyl hydrolase protein n=1 Tax=Botryosphaeria parva (strain UCR-NP2) TaxID=1287680 RepID=R1G5Y4_BOTPV|nr:putative xylosidase glycosyl hydrolase protein [Neofusicoccum parvum UCRNP2]